MTSPAVARPRHRHLVASPDLRLVEGRARSARTPARVRPATVLACAVVLVFSTLIAAAVVHSMLVSGQAELDDITAQTRIEEDALLREQLELAELQSPSSITSEAERMGMVPSQSDNWLTAQSGPDGTTTDLPETDLPEAPAPAGEVAAATVDQGGPTP